MTIDITLIILSCLAVFAFWLFRDKDFSTKDMISFGNYLLSKERFDRMKDEEDLDYGTATDKDVNSWEDRNV